MNSTYSIKASKLPAMHRAVAQIQRRAAKLGVQAPVVTVGQPYDAYFTPTHSSPRRVPSEDVADYRAKGRTLFVVPYVDVQVEGEPVKLAGWTFVAALEHLVVDGERANLLRVSPRYDGPALPERFRAETPTGAPVRLEIDGGLLTIDFPEHGTARDLPLRPAEWANEDGPRVFFLLEPADRAPGRPDILQVDSGGKVTCQGSPPALWVTDCICWWASGSTGSMAPRRGPEVVTVRTERGSYVDPRGP